jgi:hypothetical protein
VGLASDWYRWQPVSAPVQCCARYNLLGVDEFILRILRVARKEESSSAHACSLNIYAAFFALNFAHLARCAAAIRLRAPADIVRFGAAVPFRL